jgi:hypothetical protein
VRRLLAVRLARRHRSRELPARVLDAMTVTVSVADGQMVVAGGVDFAVDWESGNESPGLAILNKDEKDVTAKQIAYFHPDHWQAVVVTP